MTTPIHQQDSHERPALLHRILGASEDALTDSELLELLLTVEPGWQDTASLARDLLARFGSFAKVIHAEPRALRAVEGMTGACIGQLALLRTAMARSLKSNIDTQRVISSLAALVDYLTFTMGHERVEEFRVLFLNHRYALIADEVMQRGTVDHTPIYSREVVKRALEHDAGGLILVHNHPSGDTTPSLADIHITRDIMEAAATVKILVHEHLIVTEAKCLSFRSMGLFGQCPEMPDETVSTQYDLFDYVPVASTDQGDLTDRAVLSVLS